VREFTQEELNILNTNTPNYRKKILLSTRTWSAGENKFIYNLPIDISRYVLNISPIKSKLDTEGYAVWNNASATLTLSNAENIFAQNNTQDNFLYASLVEVFAEIKDINSGDNEQQVSVKIFRGFILTAPIFQEEERALTLTLSGELARLATYSALPISILHSEVLIAQGEDEEQSQEQGAEQTIITTPHFAVGKINGLWRGLLEGASAEASLLKEEIDYKISKLNDYSGGAEIALNNPLTAGEGIWATYRCWHKDKTVEWAAEEIAKHSQSLSWDIDPVNFSENVEAAFAQPSPNSFDEGINISAQINEDCITLLSSFLSDGNFSWSVVENTGVSFNLTPSSIITDASFNQPATVAASSSQAYGTWEVQTGASWVNSEAQFNYFISSTNNRSNTNGYALSFFKNAQTIYFNLYKVNNGSLQIIGMLPFNTNATMLRYRLSRSQSGEFKIWAKNVETTSGGNQSAWVYLGQLASDNTFTASNYQLFIFIRRDGASYLTNNIYDIKTSPLAAHGGGNIAPSAEYQTPVLDGGAGLVSWGNITFTQEISEGTSANIYWRSKQNEADDFTPWQLAQNGQTPVNPGRYLQLLWVGQSDEAQTLAPKLISWGVNWFTRNVSIAMLNTNALTCLDAIKELALLTGYKIGYDAEGKSLIKPAVFNLN
jgi:hypothetical protein